MNLLVIAIVLGILALRRGWRIAPVLLVAASAAASWLAPEGVATALARGLAILSLVAIGCTDPAEHFGPRQRPAGSLYQI